MAVVIVHYHLSAGGVTQVIRTTSAGLTRTGVPHLVLTGSPPPDPSHDLPFASIDGLSYRHEADGLTAAELLGRMRSAVWQRLGDGPHVWHFHNPSLGVHVLIPEVVSRLAHDGERLVLQLHDLAEDGRPENHQRLRTGHPPYPIGPRIRYAFLNSRDLSRFTAAGLPPGDALLLPNPIDLPNPPWEPHAPDSSPLVLYPVRAIRRKNLGEVLLLAALAPPATRFAVTRAPEQARWKPVYEDWQAFARSTPLPVDLAVADRLRPPGSPDPSFSSWLHHATHFLTTSVAEGFGLAFLEPAALGKPLFGRNLPMITQDHARLGIQAGTLHDGLMAPLSWIGHSLLRRQFDTRLKRLFKLYDRPLRQGRIDEAFDCLIDRDRVDFGNLPECLQQQVLQRLLDTGDRAAVQARVGTELVPATDWLDTALSLRSSTVPAHCLEPCSLASHLGRLAALERDLMTDASPASVRFLPADDVLDAFLKPSGFHFLMT